MKASILSVALLVVAAIASPLNAERREQSAKAIYNRNTRRQSDSDTENELLDGLCAPVTVIFARGTLELGNVGLLAGPPFFDALDSALGESNLVFQGVDYAASVIGYLEGGDPEGAATLASLAEQAVSQCPSTQIVLSGYR